MNTEEKLKKIKELADKMYSRMAYLTSDTRPIREAMDEYHQFIINEYHKEEPTIPDIVDEHFDEMLDEEPINNGLDLGCGVIWKDELIKLAKGKEPVSEDLLKELKGIVNIRECVSQGVPVIKIARHFAEWQKAQFEKNRLKHCNSITNEQAELEQGFIDQHLDKHQRMPTFLDAIEYGMNLQKEQMMAKAVMTAFNVSLPSGVYDKLKAQGCKDGDKLLIVTKEG